nr:ATP-binding protein [bacterium]
FLALHTPPVIMDEIQYAPELLAYIKEIIDEDRSRNGQFLLTGSQDLLISEKVSETLAGRMAVLRLMPFTNSEKHGQPQRVFFWDDSGKRRQLPASSGPSLWDSLVQGFYPETVTRPGLNRSLWYGSYLQTYLERDIRSLRQIGDLMQYQSFLKILASRSGQILNLSDVSKDIGIALNTSKTWLSILEATHQIIVLRPYFANIGKRLVKRPKVYFLDTGLLCHILGLTEGIHAASGPLAGTIMETAVISEIYKSILHRGLTPEMYFWRTSTGVEVDLLIRWQGRLLAIEIKSSATPRTHMKQSIVRLKKDLGREIAGAYVIHAGDIVLPLGDDVPAIPFGNL